MPIVSKVCVDGFRDFNLKELLLLTVEHSLDVGAVAALLISEKYGEEGLRCLLAMRNHSTSERGGFLENFLLMRAKVDLSNARYSAKRSKKEMEILAWQYPELGDAKLYVKLCQTLAQET